MPEFFNPRVENTLEKQLQQMTFQRSQQDFLFKQMQSSVRFLHISDHLERIFYPQKVKNNKAMQAKTILEAEIVQLRDQAKKMEERRKLMQKKLLQIHQKNQQRSSSTSAQSVPDVSSGSGERSTSFFDKEGPMFSQHNRKNLKNDSNSKPNP